MTGHMRGDARKRNVPEKFPGRVRKLALPEIFCPTLCGAETHTPGRPCNLLRGHPGEWQPLALPDLPSLSEVINLESRRDQAAESKACPQCGGVWWQASVVISAETEKVTAYAAPLRCLGCVDHVPKIGGEVTFDELHAAPPARVTPETPDPESERWADLDD